MKYAFDKQDVFNLCAVRTAKKTWQSGDIENVERHARSVIESDLLFDVFRRHAFYITFSAGDITALTVEYRNRDIFSESTETLLEWLEYCVLNYRFERQGVEKKRRRETRVYSLYGNLFTKLHGLSNWDQSRLFPC